MCAQRASTSAMHQRQSREYVVYVDTHYVRSCNSPASWLTCSPCRTPVMIRTPQSPHVASVPPGLYVTCSSYVHLLLIRHVHLKYVTYSSSTTHDTNCVHCYTAPPPDTSRSPHTYTCSSYVHLLLIRHVLLKYVTCSSYVHLLLIRHVLLKYATCSSNVLLSPPGPIRGRGESTTHVLRYFGMKKRGYLGTTYT